MQLFQAGGWLLKAASLEGVSASEQIMFLLSVAELKYVIQGVVQC